MLSALDNWDVPRLGGHVDTSRFKRSDLFPTRRFPYYLPLISSHSPVSGHPSQPVLPFAGFPSPSRAVASWGAAGPCPHTPAVRPRLSPQRSPASFTCFFHLLLSRSLFVILHRSSHPVPPSSILLRMAFISATPILASSVRYSRAACTVRPGKSKAHSRGRRTRTR